MITPIAILVPTRQRAERFENLVCSLIETAADLRNFKILACVEANDPEKSFYKDIENDTNSLIAYGLLNISFVPLVRTSHKLNMLAQLSNSSINLLLTDGCRAKTKDWDTLLIDWYNSLPAHKVCVSGINNLMPWSRTYCEHFMFTKAYKDIVGDIINPNLIHFWSDPWICEIAKNAGIYQPMQKHIVFEALHAKLGTMPKDSTYWSVRTPEIIAEGDLVWKESTQLRQEIADKIKKAIQQ